MGNMGSVFSLGILSGATAFLWCRVLTAPGMAAAFVPYLYWRMFSSCKGVPSWAEYLAKPLFLCPVCNAFWIVLIVQYRGGQVEIEGIVAALFFAYVFDRLNERYL